MSKKGITPKQAIDPIDKIVGAMGKEKETADGDTADIHRVAFNMPKYIYDTIHPKLKKQKVTMTNYILGLIRKDIGEM